ncbi:MAG: hypothetical protein PHD48_09235 [Alphaproteobacteria bacterium]|nr:hypothetical protein [Alphaproteobacteria bacterium]
MDGFLFKPITQQGLTHKHDEHPDLPCGSTRHQSFAKETTSWPALNRKPLFFAPILCITATALSLVLAATTYQNILEINEAAKTAAIQKVLAGKLHEKGSAQGRLFKLWEQSVISCVAHASFLYKNESYTAVTVQLPNNATPDVRTYERVNTFNGTNCWVRTGAKNKSPICTP